MDPVARQRRTSVLENAPFLYHHDSTFKRVIEEAVRAAARAVMVLLYGESGTGKERVARLMHERSGRPGPFVPWSAPLTRGSLLQSELFGHLKWAFTDAKADHDGYFLRAAGGTLFADDIDKLEREGQPALLRYLDDRRAQRVGDSKSVELDVLFIAATNRDLEALARQGEYLPDLANRLRGLTIRIPPLRERAMDIPILAEYFAREYGLLYHGIPAVLAPEAMDRLAQEPWPSNVRGLNGVVENAVFRSPDGRVDVGRVLAELGSSLASPLSPEEELRRLADLPMDDRVSEEVIRRAIGLAGGVGKNAAAALGIPLRTFRRLTDSYSIRWRAQ